MYERTRWANTHSEGNRRKVSPYSVVWWTVTPGGWGEVSEMLMRQGKSGQHFVRYVCVAVKYTHIFSG